MQKEENHSREEGKKVAAACGLYCEACALFIGTTDDPARLKSLAERFQVSEEAVKCYGCRADKRGPYCDKCKMFACAAERGIDFCIECAEYPCDELKEFQSAMPHRIELFDDLERIGAVGYEQWLKEISGNYTCPQCYTINSTYDIQCRKCGQEPSCNYVAKHKEEIELFLKNR